MDKSHDMSETSYQLGFSEVHRHTMYDEKARAIKAKKVLSIIEAELGPLNSLQHLDIGCSTGFMTRLYAERFLHSTGVDIDQSAVEFARKTHVRANIDFVTGDADATGLPSETYDVITCTHIYEHVPDSRQLLAEIHRLLKPGGACFFAAGNRFVFMEEHYHLPFLSVIPKPLAHRYISLAGKGSFYYENHLSYWELRKLVSQFDVIDYTLRVIRDPEKFSATDVVVPGSLKQKIALGLFQVAYWLCPTYLWVLKKRK